MLVKDFITDKIPVLKSFDTVEYALGMMNDWRIKHLPVVKGLQYHCLVSDKELSAYPSLYAPVGDCADFAPAVDEAAHIHEALAAFAGLGLSLLPVTSPDGVYMGVLTRDGLIEAMAEYCGAGKDGSIIVLELQLQDYSLSDIARIVEANKGHIQNVLSHLDGDTGRLLITIKIDLEDASPVIRSFERFNYTVAYHFMKAGMVDDTLRLRMNELMYYINM